MHETESVLYFFGLIAMVAEAMTAALAAGRRQMDWFGVAVLGSVTALGGGSLRDVLLGHYPLLWVKHPMLLLMTGGAALLTIALARVVHRFNLLFLVLDAIGLVVFTIIGCSVALEMDQPLTIVVVAGMISGCAGGVLRDILCTEVPLLFRSELYASVALVTGALYVLGMNFGMNPIAVMIGSVVVGFVLRLLAIRYKWEMPKFIYERGER